MHSESYRIIPDRHNFLSFLQTLELSPEQNACIRKIPLDYVEINERTNTWKISYGVETNPLEEQNLMAVAKKIAAACCVEEVSFINEKARDVYPPCEEDKPRDSVDVAFLCPKCRKWKSFLFRKNRRNCWTRMKNPWMRPRK